MVSLHDAARAGWSQHDIRKLLKETVDINALDEKNKRPLICAAESGHEGVVQVLLEANDIDPNAAGGEGWMPLLFAASLGRPQIVQSLLQTERIDPNLGNDAGLTPLMAAVREGHTEVVRLLLLVQNIDLNARNQDGESALSYAAGLDHPQILQLLLEAKDINLQTQNCNGRTPLSYASRTGTKEAVQLLLQKNDTDPNYPDEDGRTPLSYAAECRRPETVRLLLQVKDIEPNRPDGDGRTPLSYAAEAGNEETVRLLLQVKDIEPNLPDGDGRTPLSYATEWGRQKTVQLLLQTSGVDVTAPDNKGRTPLSFAAAQGSAALVRILVDSTRSHDRTAISWAAEYGHFACILLLVTKEHMDPSSKDPGGRTPLLRALENGHESVVRYLAHFDTGTFHKLIQEGQRDLVQQLLEIQPDVVDAKDSRGQTSLHVAIQHGQTDIVQDLIAYDADINSERLDGLAPLRLAIQLKDILSIEKLLEKGVRVTRISIENWFEVYNKDSQRVAAELLVNADNAKRLCFSERKPVDVLTDARAPRILLSLYTCSRSKAIQALLTACPEIREFLRNSHTATSAFHMFSKEIKSDKHTLIYLVIRYPIGNPNESQYFEADWDLCAIAWTIVPPTREANGPGWRSVAHVSMLPNGWIPEDVVDFFQQFMRYLQERWIELCDSAEEHMSHQRLRQLREKGENHNLIQHLAEDAQQWDRLRRVLRFEVLSLQEFAKKHFQQYDTFNAIKALEAIESFSDEVGSRLRLLDQTIRDLLQFEFAWASINEAHKSTSLATSMKRLSWITFVFLPAMFASSLFGMNVNILASNPDWRWYILFVSVILAITILGWLLFKYGQIEQWTERHIGARFSRLGNVRRGQGSGKEGADTRF